MFTFLLIGSLSRHYDIPMLIDKLGVVRKERGERYIAEAPAGMQDGWIAIRQLKEIDGDFEMEELELVRRYIADPCFFLIEGRDGELKFSDRFVLELDRNGELLIDNDHGLIEDVGKVQKRIRSGMSWLDANH